VIDEGLECVGKNRLAHGFAALDLAGQKRAVAERDAALQQVLLGERRLDQLAERAGGYPVTFDEVPQHRGVEQEPVEPAPTVAARPDQ
jgi:hypothetical protein